MNYTNLQISIKSYDFELNFDNAIEITYSIGRLELRIYF